MSKLKPSTRPKVKGDTFFLPESNGSVYFRNNIGSFRMEGKTIGQWIEKLIPVFNGNHSLEELTDGLPKEYQEQVFAIAESLYRNGFILDVSQDHPDQLSDKVLQQYQAQIEFLSNLAGSGAYRFQCYRQSQAVVIGSGPFFVSLVSALLDSGLSKFHMLITDSTPTNRQRIQELEEHARQTDSEVAIEELSLPEGSPEAWRKIIQMFDSILYVADDGELDELRVLNAICREEKKIFIPAICWQQTGIAGPLVFPNAQGCWESAWRRIHKTALCKDTQVQPASLTTKAILANVIVFEWFKHVTGVNVWSEQNKVFLLDLETLEGNWHLFLPHPLLNLHETGEWIEDLTLYLDQNQGGEDSFEGINYFSSLTSAETGIFHRWDEGDLMQLPLAQCFIQAVDPICDGPAELLSQMVCTGLTHEEARLEAGLTGLESYVQRLIDSSVIPWKLASQEFVGVGAGETVVEGISRGLQKCLSHELDLRNMDQIPSAVQIHLNEVEDERCQFYLQALTTMRGVPQIGLGEDIWGFPVVWVGTSDGWYGNVGLNLTLALRHSLQQAVHQAQDEAAFLSTNTSTIQSVQMDTNNQSIFDIPAFEQASQREILHSSLEHLKQYGVRPHCISRALEPFMIEELTGIFGVLLRKEDA